MDNNQIAKGEYVMEKEQNQFFTWILERVQKKKNPNYLPCSKKTSPSNKQELLMPIHWQKAVKES